MENGTKLDDMQMRVALIISGLATMQLVGCASTGTRDLAHASIPEERARHCNVVEDLYFDSAGVRIRFIDLGPRNGEPVVLIHGGFTNVEEQWIESGVIAALDDTYRVIALDLRGHGKSGKPHDPLQYGNMIVDDIIRLLDHLRIEEAHIVGYSLGGRITFKLVADHPKRVISAMPNGTDAEPLSSAMRDVFERTAHSLKESGSVRPLIDHFASDGSMSEEEIEQIVETLRTMNDTEALAALLRSFTGFRPDPARLKANTVPCLCVIGEGDPNRANVDATAQYMANLGIVVVPGADHMTTFRHPTFVAAIKSFVRKHQSQRGTEK